MYALYWNSSEEHMHMHKFVVLFLLLTRKTQMYKITYRNISCSRIFTYRMVRFLRKKKSHKKKSSPGWGAQ